MKSSHRNRRIMTSPFLVAKKVNTLICLEAIPFLWIYCDSPNIPSAKNLLLLPFRNSTGKSFCILDEFGEGTLTTGFVLKFLHKIRLIAMNDRIYGVFLLFCSTLTYFAHSTHPSRVQNMP